MKTPRRITALFFIVLMSATLSAQDYPFKVEVMGKGQPIILLPGFTCTSEVWKDVVIELSKAYECHTFTFAGFGDVPPIEKPWLPKIKEGLQEYILNKELYDATLIGHSLGGTLALWLASDCPNTIKKLIIVDGLPAMGALMIPDYDSNNISYDNPYNKQLLEMSTDDFAAMAGQYASVMTLNESRMEQVKDWILQSDRKTYVFGYTDLLKLDLRNAVENIKAKMLVLGAAKPFGSEIAQKTFEEQYKNALNYELKIAENAAHFIMFDSPEWLMQKTLAFLNGAP